MTFNKSNKARKYHSPKLQELLDEITPIEMEKTKVKMQLAARIEDLMRARNYSKSQFAEKIEKHPSEITKWLSGTQNFTTDILTEIASALGVEVSTLFGKRQVQIVYRNKIVVHSVVVRQPMTLSTSNVKDCESFGNFLLNQNQLASLPMTPLN